MKGKKQFLKWLAVLLIVMVGSAETIAQQVTCLGTNSYSITPGSAGDNFVWSINSGQSNIDWVITTPNAPATNIIWKLRALTR